VIRPYDPSDAARCCEIVLACLPQLDGLNPAARELLRSKLVPDRLNAELIRLYAVVHEEDGAVLGLAALEGDEAKRLYVDPAAQGGGIGRMLLEHIERVARSRGVKVLRGEASPSASPFHERLGFRVEGPAETRLGEARFSVLLISKALDDPIGD
jgi:GNAT superfamily N-acetyltransferase